MTLLDRLDARVEANGFKKPHRTKHNVSAARLLLDLDKHTPEQVAWLIDWATSHEFWRAHIRSMSKLRQKFDTLKAQATSQAGRPVLSSGEVNPDEVLGRDLWQVPTPPEELSDAQQREWIKARHAEHKAQRLEEARRKLGVS